MEVCSAPEMEVRTSSLSSSFVVEVIVEIKDIIYIYLFTSSYKESGH